MGGINCVGKEMIELNWFDASLYARKLNGKIVNDGQACDLSGFYD